MWLFFFYVPYFILKGKGKKKGKDRKKGKKIQEKAQKKGVFWGDSTYKGNSRAVLAGQITRKDCSPGYQEDVTRDTLTGRITRRDFSPVH